MAAVVRASSVRSFSRIKNVRPALVCSRQNMSNNAVEDKEDVQVTHTGQKFDDGDYRLVRFIDKPKQINEHFAIDLIADVPPKPVKARSVYCDGGDGPLGHPKVYINLDKPGSHSCGYCGLRFFQEHVH